MGTINKTMTAVAAIGLTAFGLAAPAFASERSGTMTKWHDGDRSSSWSDINSNSSVLFSATCKHDFNARIRREVDFLPDSTTGSERINCTSYNDAVVSTGTASGSYHFDVAESYLAGGYIFYPDLTGRYRITW